MHRVTVTPLGTSAAAPTARRNVSGTLLRMDGHALLLDCGEGTQHRLQQAEWKPGALDAILITHLHGDHSYGLPGLLATLGMQGRDRPLTLVGPPGIRHFIECIFVSSYFRTPYELRVVEAERGVVFEGDEYRVEVAPLVHRVPTTGFVVIENDRRGRFDVEKARAFGIPEGPLFTQLQRGESVTVGERTIRAEEIVAPPRPGRRVAYCTDTIPCESSIELGRSSDLLIHEATYGDDLPDEAIARGHSTARGAAEIARAARARRLMLTHFSARYEDPDTLLQQARSVFENTILAKELEEVVVE